MGAVKVISPAFLYRGRARLFLDRIQSGIYIAIAYDRYIYTHTYTYKYTNTYIHTSYTLYIYICRAHNGFFSSRIPQKKKSGTLGRMESVIRTQQESI